MNNRKQQIFSMLDSLTQKELDDYLKDRKINLKTQEILEKFKRYKEKTPTHFMKISRSISGGLNDIILKYHKLGQAWTMALVLECFYDNKYKLKDLKDYMKSIMKDDEELKEYVYDCMKDF